ncbi:MAG: radical SAM protein [Dehalococcoidia bacterium]|nr:radical SAM protein [Dehalococcoidia bacterium]
MSVRNSLHDSLPLARVVGSNPRMLQVSPSILQFLSGYMGKFRVREVGDNLILHSHLPPLNSPAYSRFVTEHLLARTSGPSHAQVGITNACPQRCEYCYNRNRRGQVMDTDTVLKTVRTLREMGAVWLGLTGGEPLLNGDIVRIVESVSGDCAVKLFTTGCTLTPEKASRLRQAGLFSVSVSLDHWREEEHDRGRRYEGAFREALRAIDIFRSTGGIQVGVSAVLSREMIENDQVEEFLSFLDGLGVDEAWLSEVKPSLEAFWNERLVITEEHRLKLVKLQDRYNAGGRMTVNYLGHFEGKECFGCNAGNKMVYIDAFGEVSPCVFTPLSFGNVQTGSLPAIFAEMQEHFPSEESCFINKNYRLLQKHSAGRTTLGRADTLRMLEEVRFGGLSRFNQLHHGSGTGQVTPARETPDRR